VPGPIVTHLLPALVEEADLPGSVVVIIDQLRASTTVCAALAAGATRVVPFADPDDARQLKAALPPGSCLTGGERAGLLIPGFDLDNSPRAYTPERVRGRTIAFTTTNGTAAALLAAPADLVLVGCLGNLSALAEAIPTDARPVRLLCAGTRGRITSEDVLAAGAIAERLVARGRTVGQPDPRDDDDSTALALTLWREASRQSGGVLDALRRSRGGRNLARIGLDADVEFCSKTDVFSVCPVFFPATGDFR
jgi:2-phosphosulfolactate phosphatase